MSPRAGMDTVVAQVQIVAKLSANCYKTTANHVYSASQSQSWFPVCGSGTEYGDMRLCVVLNIIITWSQKANFRSD
jgi:hypothetical protein